MITLNLYISNYALNKIHCRNLLKSYDGYYLMAFFRPAKWLLHCHRNRTYFVVNLPSFQKPWFNHLLPQTFSGCSMRQQFTFGMIIIFVDLREEILSFIINLWFISKSDSKVSTSEMLRKKSLFIVLIISRTLPFVWQNWINWLWCCSSQITWVLPSVKYPGKPNYSKEKRSYLTIWIPLRLCDLDIGTQDTRSIKNTTKI